MNGKAAKALKRFAIMTGADYNEVKKTFKTKTTEEKKDVLTYINSLWREEQKKVKKVV